MAVDYFTRQSRRGIARLNFQLPGVELHLILQVWSSRAFLATVELHHLKKKTLLASEAQFLSILNDFVQHLAPETQFIYRSEKKSGIGDQPLPRAHTYD